MAQEYQPGMEIEVQLWKSGNSSGKLNLGLGINENTRQLLFSFSKIISDEEPARWIVAERHLRLLEFFVDHKIYFDGRLDRSGKQYGQRGGNPTFESHYESDSYETFLKLLEAKTNQESGKPDVWISSKKMYSLVGILDLILNQMDLDSRISEDEFDDKWDHFLDILEEEVIGKG